MMAQKKPLTIEELADPVEDELEELAEPVEDGVVPQPARGPGTKIYERFWGTDVEDQLAMPRVATQLVGGVGGGVSGAATGAAIGAPLGPVGAGVGALIGGVAGGFAGSFAGTVAPETLLTTAEKLGIVEPGTRKRVGLSTEELNTVIEGEMLLELATGGGITGARLLGRGVTKAATGITAAKARLADTAAKENINLLPVQVGNRAIPRGFVAVMGKFPLIASSITKKANQSEAQFKAVFEKLPARIAPMALMSDVSRQVLTDASQLATKVSDHFDAAYKDIYARADAAGATILPKETVVAAEEVMKKIAAETPSAAVKRQHASPATSMAELKTFIERSILPITNVTKGGKRTTATQSLTQIDGMMTAIDERIAKFVEEGKGLAVTRLEDIKQAVQKDLLGNITGPNAAAIASDLRNLDTEFTHKMNDLFETVAANKMGAVKRGGVRGRSFNSATRTSIDGLTDILMRGDNASDLVELKRLVEPETFKTMAASVLGRHIDESMLVGETGRNFDADTFARKTGLDHPGSKKYEHFKKMLDLSGGLTIKEVENFVSIGRTISSLDVPNPSMFMARRVTMGGAKAILTGLVPMAGVAGGAAAASAATGSMFFAPLTFIFGTRMLGHMISDPLAARSLKTVLAPETATVVRRFALVRAVRAAGNVAKDRGEINEEQLDNMLGWAGTLGSLAQREQEKK